MATYLMKLWRRPSALSESQLTIGSLLRKFTGPISVTWLLTLCETTLLALVPLFIGFAIDGLLEKDTGALMNLALLLAAILVVAVGRRVYDTRAYGTIRVELGRELAARAAGGSVSTTNARLGMGRELVDFLEEQVPELLSSLVKLAVALVLLYTFDPVLFGAAAGAGLLMLVVYAISHRRFFRLNGELNRQTERQVTILAAGSPARLLAHLSRLRRTEVRISDTEAVVYGLIFFVLLSFIVFNLWFAATHINITVGSIFSIISYSWEFVEAAIILPATLQGWSRLSEIMQRINAGSEAVRPEA
ncbi:MAG: ABC transporter six-transmembrane domain-containing protein [Pseudomonadota bacterium]